MKKYLPAVLILQLLFSVFLPTGIASAASLDEVLDDARDGQFENFSLLQAMLIASNTSSAEISQLSSATDAKISEFVTAPSGSAAKQLDTILKNLRTKVLKQYYPGSSWQSTLSEGNFDPLWGTGLVVYILGKSTINCKLIETPANYLIAVKDDSGAETLFDVFAGKDPIKPSFEEYISKSAGLRSSFQVKKFPPFSLSSAPRYDCSRILVGVLQKRLIQSVSEDNYKDYDKVFKLLHENFEKIVIDQDKLVEALSKKLSVCEDPKQAIPLIKIAQDTNRKVQVDTKEMNDNAILASRKSYLAIKAQSDWTSMEKYLKELKPLVPPSVYEPMAKEGFLNIFNGYWSKKNYAKAEVYARILCKELKYDKACPFYVKSMAVQAKELSEKGKYSDALELIEKILKEEPKNADVDQVREYIYQTQYNKLKDKNDYAGMLEALKGLRKHYPLKEEYRNMSIKTYWTWGKSYLDANDFAEGIKVLTQGFKEFSDYEPLKTLLEASYYNYAVTLSKQGNHLKAIDELKKANDKFGEGNFQRNETIADLYLQLSIGADKKGDRQAAMSYAEKGLIYSPGSEKLMTQQENLKRGKEGIEEQKIEFAPWE